MQRKWSSHIETLSIIQEKLNLVVTGFQHTILKHYDWSETGNRTNGLNNQFSWKLKLVGYHIYHPWQRCYLLACGTLKLCAKKRINRSHIKTLSIIQEKSNLVVTGFSQLSIFLKPQSYRIWIHMSIMLLNEMKFTHSIT